MRSRRINLILTDGTPFNLRTAELSNWNGKILLCPREALKSLKNLPEAKQPAVYFLLGSDSQIYVGETDVLNDRLTQHAYAKDFWNEFIALTSPEFSKTEVKYLESILVSRLQKEKLTKLLNQAAPQSPTIRQEIIDAMEDYLDVASDVLRAIGYDFMAPSQDVQKHLEQGVVVFCKGPAANAQGIWSSNGLLVKAGSLIRKAIRAKTPETTKKRINDAVKTGLLVDYNVDSYKLTQNHIFSSASAASAFVLARSSSGLIDWKTADGKKIKELE